MKHFKINGKHSIPDNKPIVYPFSVNSCVSAHSPCGQRAGSKRKRMSVPCCLRLHTAHTMHGTRTYRKRTQQRSGRHAWARQLHVLGFDSERMEEESGAFERGVRSSQTVELARELDTHRDTGGCNSTRGPTGSTINHAASESACRVS